MLRLDPFRTGIGFDSHAYSKRGSLVLGGVKFPNVPALQGHSDGDALLHAVIDALLGAAGLGDIGEMFPDSSAATKGISSVVMLRKAASRVRESGFKAVHVDVTVVADKPRLSSAKGEIRRKIAHVLRLPPRSVNIKAKTSEGLRLFSAAGGVAAWAVATLEGAALV